MQAWLQLCLGICMRSAEEWKRLLNWVQLCLAAIASGCRECYGVVEITELSLSGCGSVCTYCNCLREHSLLPFPLAFSAFKHNGSHTYINFYTGL